MKEYISKKQVENKFSKEQKDILKSNRCYTRLITELSYSLINIHVKTHNDCVCMYDIDTNTTKLVNIEDYPSAKLDKIFSFSNCKNDIERCMSVIVTGFKWSNSIYGEKYWRNIYSKLNKFNNIYVNAIERSNK